MYHLSKTKSFSFLYSFQSERDVEDEKSDYSYRYRCPQGWEEENDYNGLYDGCQYTFDLTVFIRYLAILLIIIFLLPDLLKGMKVLVRASNIQYSRMQKVRCVIGAIALNTVTLLSLYALIVYPSATSTTDTELLKDCLVLLFLNETDEKVMTCINKMYRLQLQTYIDIAQIQ